VKPHREWNVRDVLPVYTQYGPPTPDGKPIPEQLVLTPPYLRISETGETWLKHFIQWIEEQVKLTHKKPDSCRFSSMVAEARNTAYSSYINQPTTDKLMNYKVALWCMWQRAKEKAGTAHMACLGRDAWFFEVCARIEGYENTSFHPEVSTNVSGILKEDVHPYKQDAVMVDTGYRGTVAKNMGIPDFLLMSCWNAADKPKRQLLHTAELNVEGMAGIMEGSPKLWSRGIFSQPVGAPKPTRIVQDFTRTQDCFNNGVNTTKIFADVMLNPEIAKLGKAYLLKFNERRDAAEKRSK